MACSKQLQLAGSAYPRTCEDCGLGPCKNQRFQAHAQAMPSRRVEIDYTNWRGERRRRVVLPTGRFAFENNEWHPNTQWLFEAIDEEDNKIKDFAMSGVHEWKELP